MTRGSPNLRAGVLPRRIDGGVRDPLEGWARKDTALADPFSMQDPLIAGTTLGLEFLEIRQAGLAAQVAGTVDDGFDPHGAAVFEVLLDPGVFVEHVDDHPAVVATG